MTDDEARGQVGDLTQQIDAMVVRPEPVNWSEITRMANEISRIAAHRARAGL